MIPAGYVLDSCALVLRIVDLPAKTMQGTVGYKFSKAPLQDNAPFSSSTTTKPQLRLNCRNLQIDSVRVNADDNAKFTHLDLLTKETGQLTNLTSYSACLASDLAVANEGELTIPVPSSSNDLVVDVSFSLEKNSTGVCVFKTNSEDAQEDHMFTRVGFHSAPTACGARCLFPTFDADNKFKIPQMRIFIETSKHHVAVAPGRLVRTTQASSSTHMFEFDHSSHPISPYFLNVCVGPFVKSQPLPWFTTYVLANRAYRLASNSSVQLAQSASSMLQYLEQDDGSHYYSQVFVDTEETLIPGSTVSFLPDSFISDCEREWVCKETESKTLLLQLTGLAVQFFGQTCADSWIPIGLSLFCALRSMPPPMQSLVLHVWLERIQETNTRVHNVSELVSKPGLVLGRPLSQPKSYSFPVDSALWQQRAFVFTSTFACKSGFVMRMLEQRASSAAFQDACRRIASRAKTCKNMSELAFLTLLKARASQLGGNRQMSMDIDSTFVTQWLRHSHVPKFTGEVSYNQKTNKIEIVLRQQQQQQGGIYTGAVKLRIVEVGGTWDYDKQIDHIEHRWVFELRTVRRKGKGGRKKRTVEEKKEGWRHPEALQANTLLQMAETKERYWDSNSTVRYVLLDPDCAWAMDLQWKQPEEFWLEMLHDTALQDRVQLQIWIVRQFAKSTAAINLRASSAITAVAVDTSRHDTVRVEALKAALSLHQRFAPQTLNSADSSSSWMGMNLLLSAFKQLYCSAETGEPLPFTTHAGEYAVRATLLDVLSQIRARDGSIPEEILEAVFDSVRMCDNSGNAFDDGPMLSALAVCAGNIYNSNAQQSEDMDECLRWIKSALDFDSVSPNYRKQTTIGCLHALSSLECSDTSVGVDFLPFLTYHDPLVRLTAFECIVRVQVQHKQDFNVLGSLLLKQCVPQEICVATQHKMLRALLNVYADTKGKCFHALTEPTGRNLQVELALWDLMNGKSKFDSELRILSHQLWRLVYGLDYPAEAALRDLGPLQNWALHAQEEWNKDEDTLINMEQINKMQAKQQEMVREREEAKRLQMEQNPTLPQNEGGGGEAVVMGEEEIIMMDDADDFMDEDDVAGAGGEDDYDDDL